MNEVDVVRRVVRETAERVAESGHAETLNVSSILCDRQHLVLSELRDIATAASVEGIDGLRARATVSAMPGHAVLVTVSPLPSDPTPLDAAEVQRRLAALQTPVEGGGLAAMVAAVRVEELRALARLFDTVAMYDTQLAPLCELFDVVREAALAAGWKGATFPPREVLAMILAHERRTTTSEAQLRAERDAWRTAALEGRPPAREVVGAMESMRFIANRAARSTFDTLAMLETFIAAETERCARTVEALAVDAVDAEKGAEAEALRRAAAALHARREAALRGAAPEVDAMPTVARRRVVAIRAAILAHGPAPTGCMSVADDRDGSATLSLVSMDGVRRAWFVANPDGGHVVMTAPRVPGMDVRNGLPIAEQAEAARRFVGWP